MEKVTLREVLEIIIKGKWLISIIVVLSVILGTAGVLLMNPFQGTAKIILQMNFKGIGEGQNPDGTRFDTNTFKDPVIIHKALESLSTAKAIDVESVRRNINVEPIVPDSIVEKIVTLQKQGQDYTYFPSQFTVSLNISKPGRIDSLLGRDILNAVVDRYIEDFSDKYSGRTVLANSLAAIEYKEYDYPEISTVMRSQMNTIKNLLSSKQTEDRTFRSKETGMSFNDIIEALNVMEKVELSHMDSIIGANNLTKDKDKLITKYEYTIKMNNLESSKKASEAKIAKDMMASYKQEQNKILIPGLNTGAGDIALQTGQDKNTYYDQLAARSTDSNVEAQNRIYDNAFIIQEIAKLKKDTVPAGVKAAAEKDVLALIDSLKVKLQKMTDISNKTLLEYYRTSYDKSIMPLSPVEVVAAFSLKLILMISSAAGLVIGTLIVLFREYWRSTGE